MDSSPHFAAAHARPIAAAAALRSTGARAQAAKRIEQCSCPRQDHLTARSPIKNSPAARRRSWSRRRPWGARKGVYLLSCVHSQQPPPEVQPRPGVTSSWSRPIGPRLTRDCSGRVLACEHDTRRVRGASLTQPDGCCNIFQGRRFKPPNDVVVKSDGAISSRIRVCSRGAGKLI